MMQEAIKRGHSHGKLLPDLRACGNETVAVFTDYGGEDNKERYFTYSTLVCGWNLSEFFLHRMKSIRQKHSLEEKEIAFKDFRMGQLQRALPDYLNALDTLPGFLFTLVVDKHLSSLFGPAGKETRDLITQTLKSEGFGERKPAINEKLLRIVHIAAFLTGLLAHNTQKIFWMTDHDSISPTAEMHEKTLSLFQRVLGMYTNEKDIFPILGGALPFDERSVELLDFLSATDVCAGSLSQYLTQVATVKPGEEIIVKAGCERVLQWLAHDGIGLKKMNVIMRPGPNGIIKSSILKLQPENPPKNVRIIPIFI